MLETEPTSEIAVEAGAIEPQPDPKGGSMSTTVQAQTGPPAPLPAATEVYRLTVDQFDRMVRDGMLGEDEPVELLNGVLVKTMPKNPAHRVGLRKTILALQKLVPTGWHVAKEEALTVGPGCK
jgi:hypothetical protein